MREQKDRSVWAQRGKQRILIIFLSSFLLCSPNNIVLQFFSSVWAPPFSIIALNGGVELCRRRRVHGVTSFHGALGEAQAGWYNLPHELAWKGKGISSSWWSSLLWDMVHLRRTHCVCAVRDSRRERSLHDVGSCAVAAVHDSPDGALRGCLAKLYKFTHPVSIYDLFHLPLSLLFSEPFQRESSIVLALFLHSPVYKQCHRAV